MRYATDKICRENQNKHFVFNNFYFENLAVYEKMWKQFVETDRKQITIWRMSIACWLNKATDTQSVPVILIALPLQLFTQTRLIVTFYVHCLSCFHLKLIRKYKN